MKFAAHIVGRTLYLVESNRTSKDEAQYNGHT